MNPGDVNASSPPPGRYVPYDDPNAALWASITPPSDPSLSTKVQRRVAAYSPDMLAHRLRLALPGIFPSHAIAFYAVLVGAMTLGATVGLLGFAAADALKSESSAVIAETQGATRPEPVGASRVVRETPSLRPAATDAPQRSAAAVLGSTTGVQQTLTTVTPPSAIDDVDSPAPPRAKRRHATSKVGKKKAKRAHLSKRRAGSRRDTKPRVRNEKARALARALGG